jgi:CHASE3 domain sensor protein
LVLEGHRIANVFRLTSDSERGLTAIQTLRLAVISAESAQRGYILTDIEHQRREFTSSCDAARYALVDVRQNFNRPSEQTDVTSLVELVNAKINEMDKVIAIKETEGRKTAREYMKQGVGMSLRAEIDRLSIILQVKHGTAVRSAFFL